jgi:hypothetical protein
MPGFLATADELVILSFVCRGWTATGAVKSNSIDRVKLDPQGATSPRHRCMHVNLIKPEHSHIPDEIEFLLASYSVFTVRQSPDAFGCQKT